MYGPEESCVPLQGKETQQTLPFRIQNYQMLNKINGLAKEESSSIGDAARYVADTFSKLKRISNPQPGDFLRIVANLLDEKCGEAGDNGAIFSQNPRCHATSWWIIRFHPEKFTFFEHLLMLWMDMAMVIYKCKTGQEAGRRVLMKSYSYMIEIAVKLYGESKPLPERRLTLQQMTVR